MKKSPQKLPDAFEEALLAYLKQNYLKKNHSDKAWNERDTEYFARGIVALNNSFTKTRSVKAFNYFNDPVMRSGYLAYFLPVNAMKAYGILSQHLTFDVSKTKIRVADIGAGPLTLTMGLLFWMADQIHKHPRARVSLQIDAFEQNKKILNDGKHILVSYLRQAKLDRNIEIHVRDFTGSFHTHLRSAQKYDYLLLGNILNEFEEREEQVNLVQDILGRSVQPETIALFVEPGSKKFSRDLQSLRDHVLEATNFHVLAPCLHQNQCPLNLTAKSDWCNFTQRWEAPKFIKDFDELTDLKKEYLLYSYLLLMNEPKDPPKHGFDEFIAISDQMHAKGRLEIVGCGSSGRVRFIRSNRDESEDNAGFSRIHRGTRFKLPDYKHNNEYNLTLNSSVKSKHKVFTKS